MVKNLNLDYEEKMFGKDFNSVEELYEAVGKQVRTMPQILIDGKLIGGYNQLVEYFADKGQVNFKGEKIVWYWNKTYWGRGKRDIQRTP